MRHDAVFTGTVIEIADPGRTSAPLGSDAASPFSYPLRKVRIRITQALAGLNPNQREIVIETGMGGGDCGYGFQRGLEYIVYASKKPDGALYTGICSPTRLVENAAEDLKYFQQRPRSSPGAEILVTAFDVHGTWRRRGDGLL